MGNALRCDECWEDRFVRVTLCQNGERWKGPGVMCNKCEELISTKDDQSLHALSCKESEPVRYCEQCNVPIRSSYGEKDGQCANCKKSRRLSSCAASATKEEIMAP